MIDSPPSGNPARDPHPLLASGLEIHLFGNILVFAENQGRLVTVDVEDSATIVPSNKDLLHSKVEIWIGRKTEIDDQQIVGDIVKFANFAPL